MSYTVAKLKQDLERKLHGTTLNQVTNIESMIEEGASILLLDLDPQETKRTEILPNVLYNKVFEYQAPTDLKGNKVINIYPMAEDKWRHRFTQTYQEAFGLLQKYPFVSNFTVDFNSGTKFLRINNSYDDYPGILLNAQSGVTNNGTWTVGGQASGLTADLLTFISSNASLQFDLDQFGMPTTGWIENSTMASQDLTSHLFYGAIFEYVYIPITPSAITSFELRWGSSPTDYWFASATAQQDNTAFQVGWNLLIFNWDTAGTVGNPDVSNVTYSRFTTSYNGTAIPGMRVNNLVSRIGEMFMIEYYSKCLFRDAVTGAFQDTITDDTNIVNLDTETYNVFLELVAVLAFQQQAGRSGRFDIDLHNSLYSKALKRYKQMYKSEILKPKLTYYPVNKRRGPWGGPFLSSDGLLY